MFRETSCGSSTRKFLLVCFQLLSLLTWPPDCTAQTNPSWQHCFGGGDDDWVNSVDLSFDGGYILAGMTRSNDGDVSGNHGWMDAWIVKLDESRHIGWQRCFGGDQIDEAYDVQQTLDGGFVVVGGTRSSNGDIPKNQGQEDYFVLKLASDGSIEWVKTFGGSKDDRATAVTQTPDGGYLVSGYILSDDGDVLYNHGAADIWVLKLDAEGEIQWQKPIGGTDWDIPEAMVQTKDYGFVVAGHSYSDNGDNTCTTPGNGIWVVRVKPTWTIDWNVCLPGATAHSVISSSDSGFLVGGEDLSGKGIVFKLTGEGEIEWHQDLKAPVYSIRQTLQEEIITAGQGTISDSCRSGISFQFAMLGPEGTIRFQKTFGGQASDWARSITRTIGGGFLLAGGSMSDDCDVEGNHNAYLFSDAWLMVYDQEIPVEEHGPMPLFTVAPNPANNFIRLKSANTANINLFSSSGKWLAAYQLTNEIPLTVDLSGYSAGLYLLLNRESGQSVKLVKE